MDVHRSVDFAANYLQLFNFLCGKVFIPLPFQGSILMTFVMYQKYDLSELEKLYHWFQIILET